MTDDQLELVNAYLDGEATVDERALVESDAELVAEVARMRSVRNALSDIELPSATVRESAIAAALAAFEERPTVPAATAASAPRGDATAPTNIVPFERRRRMRRLQGLGAAAAAVMIVAGGIAISRRDDGGSTAQRDADSAVESAPGAQLPAGTTNTSEAPPTTPAPMMAVVPTTVGFEPAEAEDATGGAAADEAAEDTLTSATDSAAMALPAGSAPSAGVVPAAPAPDDSVARLEVLRDEDDLIDFAATMKDLPFAADIAETLCEDGTLKADASYEDDEGDEHPIVVVVIGDDGEQLAALSLDDCAVVLPAE